MSVTVYNSISEFSSSVDDAQDILAGKGVVDTINNITKNLEAGARDNARAMAERNAKFNAAQNNFAQAEKKAKAAGYSLQYFYNDRSKTFEVKVFAPTDISGNKRQVGENVKVIASVESGWGVGPGGAVSTDRPSVASDEHGKPYFTDSVSKLAKELNDSMDDLVKLNGDEYRQGQVLRNVLKKANETLVQSDSHGNTSGKQYVQSRAKTNVHEHRRTLATIDVTPLNKEIAKKTKQYQDEIKKLKSQGMYNEQAEEEVLQRVAENINIVAETIRTAPAIAERVASSWGFNKKDFDTIFKGLGELAKIPSSIGELSERAVASGKTTLGPTTMDDTTVGPYSSSSNKHLKQVLQGAMKSVQSIVPKGRETRNMLPKGTDESLYDTMMDIITPTLFTSQSEFNKIYEEYYKAHYVENVKQKAEEIINKAKNKKYKGGRSYDDLSLQEKAKIENKAYEDARNWIEKYRVAPSISEDMAVIAEDEAQLKTSTRVRSSSLSLKDVDIIKIAQKDPKFKKFLYNTISKHRDKFGTIENVDDLTEEQIKDLTIIALGNKWFREKIANGLIKNAENLGNVRFTSGGEDDPDTLSPEKLLDVLMRGGIASVVADERRSAVGTWKSGSMFGERRNTMASNPFVRGAVKEATGLDVGVVAEAKSTKAADIPAMMRVAMSTMISGTKGSIKSKEDILASKAFNSLTDTEKDIISKWISSVGPEGWRFNQDFENSKDLKWEIIGKYLVAAGYLEGDAENGFSFRKDMAYNDIYNMMNVYDLTRGVSVSQKEANSFLASTGLVSNEQDRKALQEEYKERITTPESERAKKDIEKYKQALVKTFKSSKTDVKSAIEESYKSGSRESGKTISIGVGDDYTINAKDFESVHADWENGHISQEEYEKLIWAKIDATKEEISKKTGIPKDDIDVFVDPNGSFGFISPYSELDGKAEAVEGRLVYLPSTDPYEIDVNGEKGYYPPEYYKAFNSLVRSMTSGKATNASRSRHVYDLTHEMDVQAQSKSGALYQRANKTRAKLSVAGHAIGVNPEEIRKYKPGSKEYNALVAGTFVSPDLAREILSYNENDYGSIEEYKEYLEGAYRELGLENDIDDIAKGKFDTVIEKIVSNMTMDKGGLTAILNRFPTLSRLGVKSGKLFVDNSMTGLNEIKVGAGLWKLANGDFDGDTANLILGLMKSAGARSAMNELVNYTIKMASEMYEMSFDKNGQDVQTIGATELNAADQEDYNEFIGLVSKIANPNIGVFSNYATRVRGALTESGASFLQDIPSGNLTDDQKRQAIANRLTESFMQSFEQDVINSKKISDKYYEILSDPELTQEEKQNKQFELLTQYHDFIEQMRNGGFTISEIMEQAQKMGLISDDSFSGQVTSSALAEIRAIVGHDELRRLGFGELVDNNKVSSDLMERSLYTSEGLLEDGRALFKSFEYLPSAALARKFSPEQKDDPYQFWKNLQELGVEAAEKVSHAWSPIGDILKNVKNQVDAEANSEKAKIAIATKESSAIDKLTGSYDKLKDVTENLDETANGKYLVHKSLTGALDEQIHEDYPIDYSGFNAAVAQRAKGRVTLSDGSVYKYDKANGKWINKSGEEVTDAGVLEKIGHLGYTKEEYERYRQGSFAKEKGLYAHEIAELLNKYGVSSLEELEKLRGKRGTKTDFKNLDKAREKLLGELSILYEEDDVEKIINDTEKIGESYRSVVSGMGFKKGMVLAEQHLNLARENDILHGRTDLIGLTESGDIQIADYKTRTGKGGKSAISAKEVAQAVEYVTATQSLVEELASGKYKTAQEFMDSAAGKALGYGYTNARGETTVLTDQMFNMLMEYIEDRREKTGYDLTKKSGKEKDRQDLANHIFASLIQGSGAGAERFVINKQILEALQRDETSAGLLKKLTSGPESLTEDELKRLLQSVQTATGVLDKSGDLSGTNEAKESSPKQEEERRKRIVDLFREQLAIEKELKRIEEEKGKFSKEEDIQKLEAYKSVLDKKLKENKEALKDESESEEYKELKAEKDVKDLYTKGTGKEKALSSFRKMLKKRADMEAEIYRYQLDSNLAVTDRERATYQKMILHKKRDIDDLNRGVNGQPGIDSFWKDYKDDQDFAEAFSQYNLYLEELNTKTLAAHKGQTTFWDALTRDIKKSVVALNNFNIAHKVIQKIPQDLRKVINITKQLDSILTNLAIVIGSSTKENEKYLDSYIDLANQLGVTTTQVAQATTEWLRQGYSVQESQKLVTASIQLSKLGMIDASTATRDLTKWIRYTAMYRKI